MGDVHTSYLINAGTFISGLHPKFQIHKQKLNKWKWPNLDHRWIASPQADNVNCKFVIRLYFLIDEGVTLPVKYVYLLFFFLLLFFGGVMIYLICFGL